MIRRSPQWLVTPAPAVRYEATLQLKSAALAIHQANQEKLAQEVTRFMAENPAGEAQLFKQLSDNLAPIFERAHINLDPYVPKNTQQFGKYLAISIENGEHPLCVQLFAFGPNQKTLIHSHPWECASIVLRGHVIEKTYETAGLAPMVQPAVS